MPRGTTPLPLHNGQATPSWAAIALRINALLFGSLLSKSARSVSTLNATTAVFGGLRDMASYFEGRQCLLTPSILQLRVLLCKRAVVCRLCWDWSVHSFLPHIQCVRWLFWVVG